MVRPVSGQRRLDAARPPRPASAGVSGPPCQPVPYARGALHRGLRPAADPHRQIRLHRLGRDGGAAQRVVPSLEIHLLLGARARRMTSSASSVRRPRVFGSRPIACHSGAERAADAEARQQPPSGQRHRSWRTAWPAAPGRASPARPRSCRTSSAACGPPSPPCAAMHSRIGCVLTSRSVCQRQSTPPCSQRSTQRQKPPMRGEGELRQPEPDGDGACPRSGHSASATAAWKRCIAAR